MDVNDIIPSFGQFVIDCKDCEIPMETTMKMFKELCDDYKYYDTKTKVKDLISENVEVTKYIELIGKLNL